MEEHIDDDGSIFLIETIAKGDLASWVRTTDAALQDLLPPGNRMKIIVSLLREMAKAVGD